MSKGTLSKVGAVGLMAGLVVAAGSSSPRWVATGRAPRRRHRCRPLPVVTDVATTKDVPVLVRGIGTVQAYETVAVKTRVDGQIVKVAFTEGQFVKAGDLLFQIDPRRSRRCSITPTLPSSATRRSLPAPGWISNVTAS